MSYRVVVAAGTPDRQAELAEPVAASGGEIVAVTETVSHLLLVLSDVDPEVVLLHEDLAEPLWPVVRTAATSHPHLALVVAVSGPTSDTFATAMASGARGVMTLPIQVDEAATGLLEAAQWSQTVRQVIRGQLDDEQPAGNGFVVAFAGAKGGVGTTTVAVHLALAAVTHDPARRVCLVDLDVVKGDVLLYLDAQHRRTILDLAPISHDLGPRALDDALYLHPSGLRVLLAPDDAEHAEDLDGQAVLLILAALRRSFDLIVVDVGAFRGEAQAAALEVADEVHVVVTPDVPALRGARRLVELWDRLAVRKEEAVRVVLNRVDRRTEVQPETAARIAGLTVAKNCLPAAFRSLEIAANRRAPSLAHPAWQARIRLLAVELGLARASLPAGASAGGRRHSRGRRRAGEPAAARLEPAARGDVPRPAPALSRVRGERGQATIEAAGIFFLILVVILLLWQGVVIGVTAHFASGAAAEGARAAGVGRDPVAAARAAVPDAFARDMRTTSAGGSVTVTIRPPLLLPGARSLDMQITAESGQVSER